MKKNRYASLTDEQEDIFNILNEIINIPDRWDFIQFKRGGNKITIKGLDQYGSKYSWSEET